MSRDASFRASTILVATWSDGLFVLRGEDTEHELVGQSVKSIVLDDIGGALAIVDGHQVRRRAPEGAWSTIATSDLDLACAIAARNVVYVGTEDARILRSGARGVLELLRGFDAVAGRETWYAGSAIVNGQRMGPPLGIRSITATPDGAMLFANVHVGGIPRSLDGGVTWHPTIDIDADVHEVRAHPNRAGFVAAAAAVGLCTSHDSGATWRIEHEGLHGRYCSAVAFTGDDVLVAASEDHFAPHGALYRRPLDRPGTLSVVGGGLPAWLDGIADTGCVATHSAAVAVADRRGNVYASADSGRTWGRRATGLPAPSCVLIA